VFFINKNVSVVCVAVPNTLQQLHIMRINFTVVDYISSTVQGGIASKTKTKIAALSFKTTNYIHCVNILKRQKKGQECKVKLN
jgi:hypothetical protein